MNCRITICLICSCLASSACAPLQQAPLVYSSRLVVGVDVSANVAENQGGSISIGVKSVDSAYVPVAVSKQLDKLSDGQAKTLEVQLIEARYGEGSIAEASDEASNAERNRKIDEYFAARQAAEAAVSQQTSIENQVSAISTLITQLDSLKGGIAAANNIPEPASPPDAGAPPTNPRDEALKSRAIDLEKINLERNAGIQPLTTQADGKYNASQVIGSIETKITDLRKEKALNEALLPGLRTQRQIKADHAAQAKAEAIRSAGLSQTNKTDAMSVYGRFDSDGSGGSNEGKASLLVGKVFSTGLASQNLTEAVKLEARSRCLASGFEFAKDMQATEKKGFFDNLANVCTALQANSSPK